MKKILYGLVFLSSLLIADKAQATIFCDSCPGRTVELPRVENGCAVDKQPPRFGNLTFNGKTGNGFVVDNGELAVNATDNNQMRSVDIFKDNTLFESNVFPDANGNFVFVLGTFFTSNGANIPLTIIATDVCGNTSRIDTSIPSQKCASNTNCPSNVVSTTVNQNVTPTPIATAFPTVTQTATPVPIQTTNRQLPQVGVNYGVILMGLIALLYFIRRTRAISFG